MEYRIDCRRKSKAPGRRWDDYSHAQREKSAFVDGSLFGFAIGWGLALIVYFLYQ